MTYTRAEFLEMLHNAEWDKDKECFIMKVKVEDKDKKTLSDDAIDITSYQPPNTFKYKMYSEERIKQFIKDIKEDIKKRWHGKTPIHYIDMGEIIDKRVGERLI